MTGALPSSFSARDLLAIDSVLLSTVHNLRTEEKQSEGKRRGSSLIAYHLSQVQSPRSDRSGDSPGNPSTFYSSSECRALTGVSRLHDAVSCCHFPNNVQANENTIAPLAHVVLSVEARTMGVEMGIHLMNNALQASRIQSCIHTRTRSDKIVDSIAIEIYTHTFFLSLSLSCFLVRWKLSLSKYFVPETWQFPSA